MQTHELFRLTRFVIGVCLAGWSTPPVAADWPQGSGAEGRFHAEQAAPGRWSVVRDENIRWKITLPETGQNTPVVADGKVFFSTLKPASGGDTLGKDIVAWCCDADSGDVLWQREILGTYPLRLSGCFGDSSSPPATVLGNHVVFANASGRVACFDFDGNTVWSRKFLTVNRTLPFVHRDRIVLTRQIYPPDPNGVFPHRYADSPHSMWTQLHALDFQTGEDRETTRCGINMGCAVLPQRLADGCAVAVVGRGGGHGPPEKPDGISLIDLDDHSTVWTFPIEGFMATMSYRVRKDEVHIFDRGDHVSIDALTGKELRRHSIVDEVLVRRHHEGRWAQGIESIPVAKNKRMITQTSNLLIGRWHYFRSYTRPWLGRVDVESGDVEYLELPLQLVCSNEGPDRLVWFEEPQAKNEPPLKLQSFVKNDMKNSRGVVVMGDKRSEGNGWGHVAAPTPSVAGEHLYVPVQNGTVYVIRWDAPTLNESAIVAINDLGPAGKSYTRASLAIDAGRIYAHTIRELVCIGE